MSTIQPRPVVGGLPGYMLLRIVAGIVMAGLVGFPMSYLTQRPTTSVLAPIAGVVGSAAPQPQSMIYGAFGEGQFAKPMDVTVIDQRIYVSDSNNQRIQVFDYEGQFLKRFGEKGNGQGQFQFPYGLAGDGAGNLYVADLYRGNISVFDSEGNFLRYFGEEGILDGPGDLFIKDDKLYVTDINQSRVVVFDMEGHELLEVGSPGREAGQLLAPNGVTVDDEGNIYVVDTGNQRVQVFAPDGKLLNLFYGTPEGQDPLMVNPRGIGIRGNTLFVVSNLTNMVYTFNLQGERQGSFGELGNMPQQFTLPNGLCVDNRGRIYITDTGNLRVAVYR